MGISSIVNVKPDNVIIHQDDGMRSIFVIKSGRVRSQKNRQDGILPLNRHYKGDIIGIDSLFGTMSQETYIAVRYIFIY